MRLLIDTHVLLWWDQDSADLSQRARSFIADPFDRLLVAQSLRRELTLITADNMICAFPGLATLRAR